MTINEIIEAHFEEFKKKQGLEDKDLVICKADSNHGFNNERLFILFSYLDKDGPTPDKAIEEFNAKYKLPIKNKSESGGYIFIIPNSDF